MDSQDTITINLPQGLVTVIDAIDYERTFTVARRNGEEITARPCDIKWQLRKTKRGIYAKTPSQLGSVGLHRLLMEAPIDMLVDHRDRNGLNNRRTNLRLATNSQNQANALGRNSKGKFKGVAQDTNGKWKGQLWFNNKCLCLGRYATAEEAARAYDRKALELFGEFALLNFPEEVAGNRVDQMGGDKIVRRRLVVE